MLTVVLLSATTFSQNLTPNSNYKSRVIKTSFFAPLTQHLEFGYEQALNNKMILDGSLGIIGPSLSNFSEHPKGVYLKAGTKFFFNPDFIVEGMQRYNDFQGTYFEPQLIYSGFSFQNPVDIYDPNTGAYLGQTTYKETSKNWAMSLNLGRQWVLANIVSLNIYGGIGYGGSNTTNHSNLYYGEFENHPYKFSHTFFSNNFPMILTDGLTIGILLK